MIKKKTVKEYYELVKPGIVYGNALTVVGGYMLAAGRHADLLLLLATLSGISFVIASSCVLNNLIDHDIDGKMERTKGRAMVRGSISKRNAVIFSLVLGYFGFFILLEFVNLVSLIVGLAGFLVYILLYTLWSKRSSVYGTHIGSIAGAAPPVAGYVAVTGSLDLGALMLFLIMVFWQMPHFFAIAIYRLKDYKEARIPVMPVTKGLLRTKKEIIVYIVFFTLACLSLSLFHYSGYLFAIGGVILCGVWLHSGLKGFNTEDDTLWAKKMFLRSLLVITLLFFLMTIDALFRAI